MGSSKRQTVGYWYYLGLHFGLCHGPVDEVNEIRVGDRVAWGGSVANNGTIAIDQPNLFGGEKKEGGVQGNLDLAFGGPTQPVNDYLASRIGPSIPAFRGILSAIWRGGRVTANNPYIKPWAFRVRRITKGWSTGAAWREDIAALDVASDIVFLPFVEDFSGDLSAYAFSNPAQAANNFAIVGGRLRITHVANALPISNAIRVIPDRRYVSFSADFTIDQEGYATAGYMVISGTSGDNFTMVPKQDTSFDSLERASVYINGVETRLSKLVVGANYQIRFTITEGVLSWELERIGTGVVHSGSATCLGRFNRLGFVVDNDAVPGPTVVFWNNINTIYNDGSVIKDMNPAHIVYECLTNTEWGMGYPTSTIDEPSFTAAAEKLFAENLGVSMVWNRQDTVESFIRVVLDHAGGILYVKPTDGKFALKLLRADYDRNTLPQFGPSNLITASDYQRQAWGETVNEVHVVYRDWKTNKDRSVTAQDLGNIQNQGAVVSTTRQYPGFSNPTIAQRVALRELNALATPTAKIKLSANRNAWNLIPGDVFRLTWPDFDITDVVFRVLAVDRGTLQDGAISIDAVEDVFALPDNTYVAEQPTEWVDPTTDPAPAPARQLVEVPYWELNRTLSAADLAFLDDMACFVTSLASRPAADALNYGLQTRVDPAAFVDQADGQFAPTGLLVAGIDKVATAIVVDVATADRMALVVAGGYAIIGDEYVGVVALDATTGAVTITRGVLDTTPKAHAAGARVWFAENYLASDPTEYAPGEVVDVKILPRTGRGELALDDAPLDQITTVQRQFLPYPPGLFRIEGEEYPPFLSEPASITVTWAHRDRLTQTAYLVTQYEASIGPEVATTYSVEVYDDDTDALIESFTAIAGASQAISVPTVSRRLRVELYSVRDALESYQRHVHAFDVLVGVVGARITENGDDNRTTEGGDARITE